MSTEQLDLLGLVRSSDPDTSHEAATAVLSTRNKWQHAVLCALAVLGGATVHEVWCWLAREGVYGIPAQNSLSKRCSELRDLGLIEDTGERRMGGRGVAQRVWGITHSGSREVVG